MTFASGAGHADPAADRLLDVQAVPYLGADGRAAYQQFLLMATPRAFAISPDGSFGWAAAQDGGEARAIEICSRAGVGCRLYVRDLRVVDLDVEPAVGSEAAVAAGPGWEIRSDSRFLWHGPERARGAYVWAHGRAAAGVSSMGAQPQPHVRSFNNRGYDVFRFDRAPDFDDANAAAAWMREGLAAVRRLGYRFVIAGGQSRGAWNALQALSVPGLVDGVVAIAPAAHGTASSPAQPQALEDMEAVVHEAQAPRARVFIATFRDDEFDVRPNERRPILLGFASRVGALWLLDRPGGVSGHAAGGDSRFTLNYGDQIMEFIEGRWSPSGTVRR